jgi:hypothetical protein
MPAPPAKPDPWYADRPNEANQPPVTIPLSLARALEDRCWATGENEWAAFMNKAITAAGHTPVGLLPSDTTPTPEEDALTKAFANEPHILDFKKAWAIQRARGNKLMHQPRCSSVPGWDKLSGPTFLCDCGAIVAEWQKIRGKLP